MKSIESKVSFIMPIYNSEKYICQAVYSVLNQTYRNIELILIDDCPTDSTLDKISSFDDKRILLLHNGENRGIAYSRNKGLAHASGKYVVFMDDDDISLPKRTEKQVMFMENHPEIDYVGGRYQLIDENGSILAESVKAYNNPRYIKARFLFQNIYTNGEVMARKNVIVEHGICFDENQYGMEDFKFWIECSKVGNFSTIEDIIFQHRVHPDSETLKNKKIYSAEREQHRTELLKYSMKLSNIFIPDEMLRSVNAFSNNRLCQTVSELQEYYKALNAVVCQTRLQGSDFQKEADILCRQYLEHQIRNMEMLWEGQLDESISNYSGF